MQYTLEYLAKMIDHSLLRPTMTVGDLEECKRRPATAGVGGNGG